MAALTRSGARKASEIVMWILRMLHFSRAAICSTPVTAPARISSSHRRPRAIEATSLARVSAGKRSEGSARAVRGDRGFDYLHRGQLDPSRFGARTGRSRALELARGMGLNRPQAAVYILANRNPNSRIAMPGRTPRAATGTPRAGRPPWELTAVLRCKVRQPGAELVLHCTGEAKVPPE